MAKKNRFVEHVPGETAEDRLQHYVQKTNSSPDQRPERSAAQSVAEPHLDNVDAPRERTFVSKLFGVGIMGWVQLALVCVVVGAIAETSGINPFAPDSSLGGAATAAMTGALNVLG